MAGMSNRKIQEHEFYKIYTDSDDVGLRDAEPRTEIN
jgi:hypothetical protein